MTVKRRLFISNNLMILIPVLLSTIMGTIVINMAVSILGLQENGNGERYSEFNNAVSQMRQLSNQWMSSGDPEKVAEDTAVFGEKYSGYGISLIVYQNGELLCASGNFSDENLLQTVLSRSGYHSFTADDIAIFKTDAGPYTVLLAGMGYNMTLGAWRGGMDAKSGFNFGIITFSVVIAVILATNRFLTKVVYRSIVTPLDTLVYGVHQLRDGNLEYRIEYAGKDEFAGVCTDFNEMAGRLLDMVNARQKDDENRRELIAGISHDLRTPLTSIISYVEGLEKGIATTPAIQKRYFDTIKSKSLDLEHIVSQLFLFSKLDVGEFPFKLEKLDIGDELTRFVGSIREEYEGKGLRIILDTVLRGYIVEADLVQLRNVFVNIFDNSLKYGRPDNSAICVACRADQDHVIISLTDNGPGVPEEALDNLFTVFYRGDKSRSNPGQGSGLGLAITAKILERLNGSIRAENAAGGGLRILITLPVTTGGAENEKDIDC